MTERRSHRFTQALAALAQEARATLAFLGLRSEPDPEIERMRQQSRAQLKTIHQRSLEKLAARTQPQVKEETE